MSDQNERFFQPIEDIIIVQQAPRGTWHTPEALARGRARIAAGEDADAVITEMAQAEVHMIDPEMKEQAPPFLRDALRTALEAKPRSKQSLLAEKQSPRIATAFQHAFAVGRVALRKTKSAEKAVDAMREVLSSTLPRALSSVLSAGLEVGLEEVELKAAEESKNEEWKLRLAAAKKGSKVEGTKATEWARKHAGELINDVTETSRKRIRRAITNLTLGEDWGDAMDEILKVVGDDDRAWLIANHESRTAVHVGQRLAWEQAVEDDLLPSSMKRTFIAGPVSCPICEELDGKTAKLEGEYPGGYDGPPIHVGCDCSEGLQ